MVLYAAWYKNGLQDDVQTMFVEGLLVVGVPTRRERVAPGIPGDTGALA